MIGPFTGLGRYARTGGMVGLSTAPWEGVNSQQPDPLPAGYFYRVYLSGNKKNFTFYACNDQEIAAFDATLKLYLLYLLKDFFYLILLLR